MRYQDRATKDLMATMAQKNLADRSRTREMRMPYGQRMMERYIQTAEPQIDNANAMLPQPPQPAVPQQQAPINVNAGMAPPPQPPAMTPNPTPMPQTPAQPSPAPNQPQMPMPPQLPPQAGGQAQMAMQNRFAGQGAMGGMAPQLPMQNRMRRPMR